MLIIKPAIPKRDDPKHIVPPLPKADARHLAPLRREPLAQANTVIRMGESSLQRLLPLSFNLLEFHRLLKPRVRVQMLLSARRHDVASGGHGLSHGPSEPMSWVASSGPQLPGS